MSMDRNYKQAQACLIWSLYRPPNSDANYYSSFEDSIHLAVDKGLNDIIVTGDFNFNLLSTQTSLKIEYFCTQFSLYKSIDQPTHFTENSSSLLNIILTHNKDHLIVGWATPFLINSCDTIAQFMAYSDSRILN